MQQFTVPQFIDVEDKIIGPITTRQFVIMLAGAILIAICFRLFDFSLFVTCTVLIFAVFGTFAFARVNGRPFHFFVLNVIQTMKKPKLRVWNNAIGKTDYDYKEEETIIVETVKASPKKYNASRLAELSLVVDTGGAYADERGEKEVSRHLEEMKLN